MKTSKGFPLTSDQNAAILSMKVVQANEINNNFANGDLWNNIQEQIELIEKQAERNYKNADHIAYCQANGITI